MAPTIKKRLRNFIKSEKGGVSKKALLDGAIAAGLVFVLSQAVSAQHLNNVTIEYDQKGVLAKHVNHSSHSSHSSY